MGGELPIPFMAFDAYAKRYGIEGEAFDRFLTFMQAIDSEWLEHVAKRDADNAKLKGGTA